MLCHSGTVTIETDHLILRRFEYSDAQSMIKNWVADEKVQFMYREPVYKTENEVKTLLDKYIPSYDKNDYYRWAVIDKTSSECIGQIAFYYVDSSNNYAEIEYCIGTGYQGKGYATEATKAVISFGFDKVCFHKIQICTMTINPASKRVIEKCGFVYEGTLRDAFCINGEYVGRLYFSILKSEWINKQ